MTKGDKLDVLKSSGGTFPATFENASECRECGDAIVWVSTPKGKKMALDADPDEGGVYTSHWERCKPGSGGGEAKAAAPSPSLADRVKRLEEAVFGKKAAAETPVVEREDFPPLTNDLPFLVLVSAMTMFGGM